jgi:DNA polymerase-4
MIEIKALLEVWELPAQLQLAWIWISCCRHVDIMKRNLPVGKSTMTNSQNTAGQISRAIIHVDMDAFYASVELLDDPGLAGHAVVVGGLGPRGVVATANYEARRFGVHSAMPMGRARRLCPQARYIRPRMARYRELSASVFTIFREFTPRVEGLSLDEAFLDVTASLKLFGGQQKIGGLLKEQILDRTGLTASVGMAHNKFLAKLASDVQKPDGFVAVKHEEVHAFLDPMPISRLWGVGKKTAPKLRALGILTIGQLRNADISAIRPVLGNRAEHFQQLSRGEDEREVQAVRPEKSISHEITFDKNVLDRTELLAELLRQSENVSRRLRAQQLMAGTVVVKIRDGSFQTVTRSRSLIACSNSTRTLYRMARALFETWRGQHRTTAVRLLGMGVSGLEPENVEGKARGDQLDSRSEQSLDRVFDRINQRFGDTKIVHGLSMRKK